MKARLPVRKPESSSLATALLWLSALVSFCRLVHHGWQSAHAFQGDDGQLYLGWRQLVKSGSYNLKHEPVPLVRPGEHLAPMLGPVLNAYPPHTAVFYLPFALLPWSLSHNVWTVLNIACLVLCLYLLFDRYGRNIPRYLLPVWLAALFLSGPP